MHDFKCIPWNRRLLLSLEALYIKHQSWDGMRRSNLTSISPAEKRYHIKNKTNDKMPHDGYVCCSKCTDSCSVDEQFGEFNVQKL